MYNFLCQNAQQTEFAVPKIRRGYFQYAGLLGFEKDETQGLAWLDSVADIQYNHNWRAAIKNFNWFGLLNISCRWQSWARKEIYPPR